MRHRRWIELFNDYDCEIRYHPGKENVVADALSRNKRVKPVRVQAMSMAIGSGIKVRILKPKETSSLLQQQKSPSGSRRYSMDLSRKLTRDSSGHDSIWVIVDRLTKSVHFLAIREDYQMEKLARLYINEVVARHGVPISIISYCDGRFTSQFWQMLQRALGTRLDMSMAYHP
ncbi:putative reverse transcriptase domain-containing protein [Tanacetum coccineum]